jgi:hypothetical protein
MPQKTLKQLWKEHVVIEEQVMVYGQHIHLFLIPFNLTV